MKVHISCNQSMDLPPQLYLEGNNNLQAKKKKLYLLSFSSWPILSISEMDGSFIGTFRGILINLQIEAALISLMPMTHQNEMVSDWRSW